MLAVPVTPRTPTNRVRVLRRAFHEEIHETSLAPSSWYDSGRALSYQPVEVLTMRARNGV